MNYFVRYYFYGVCHAITTTLEIIFWADDGITRR